MLREKTPTFPEIDRYRQAVHGNLDGLLKRFPNTPEGRHAMDQVLLAVDLCVQSLQPASPESKTAEYDQEAVKQSLATSHKIIDIVAAPDV